MNKEGNKVLVIKIKDEGIGISSKEINYILLVFIVVRNRWESNRMVSGFL